MNKKYAQDYRRRKREEAAAQISMRDNEMLELARRLRHCTHASFLGAGPRAQALQALQKAIDKVGFVVTGDREYFYAGSSSIG